MGDLSDSQSEKLMLLITTVGTEDLEAATKFLKATSWEVTTAINRWFEFGGDASKLDAPTRAPPAHAPPTGGVGVYGDPTRIPPVSGAAAPRPVASGSGAEAGTGAGVGGIFGSVLASLMGATGGPTPATHSSRPGDRIYHDDAEAIPGAIPPDTSVRVADRAFTETMLPSGYNPYGRRSGTDMAREWTRGRRTKRTDHLTTLFQGATYRFSGTWEQAKAMATSKKKWILVNIMSKEEFSSHCLNRDLFNDSANSELIRESFILFQYGATDPDGLNFVNLYKVFSFPFLCIVDPATGRKEFTIAVPSADKFPAHAQVIREKLLEFLSSNPDPGVKATGRYVPMEDGRSRHGSRRGSALAAPMPTGVEAMATMTEDEQLAAVLALSMEQDSAMADASLFAEEGSGIVEESAMSGPKTEQRSADVMLSADDELFERAAQLGAHFEDEEMREVDVDAPVSLEPEPALGDASGTPIRFRLPDGKLLQRRFHKQARVEQLFRFVEMNTGHGHLTLAQPMPKMILNDKKLATLESLGLMRATLVCSIEE